MGMRFKLLIIILFISTVCFSQPLKLLLQKKAAAPATSDSVTWNFSEGSQSYAGSRNVTGEPSDGVRSDTAPNGWSISTVATANWLPYSTFKTAGDNISTQTQTFFPELNANIVRHAYWNYIASGSNYDVNKWQFEITGLNTATTYRLWVVGSFGGIGFDANPTTYTVVGATSPATQTVNGNATTVSTAASWDLAPDGTGRIKVWVNNTSGSSLFGCVGVIKIKSL